MRSTAIANILFATFAVGLVSACSRNAPAPAASTAAPAVALEGAPQIAIAPDGAHIQYRVYGKGEPAVVLIHGWSCDSNYWSAQLADLKRKYTVVTVDLAGHGGSDKNRSEWTMGRFGDDVAAAMATVPNKQLVLVGHSMGGPVAMEAARRLKERTIGVIGVDTFKQIGLPPPPADQIEARLKLFETDFIGTTRQFVTESFFTKNADPALVRKIADDMSLAPPQVGIAAIRGLNAMDYAAAAQDLTVPIVALNSDLGMPTDDERIKKVVPTFRSVTLAGLGHFLMMEAPTQFNPLLDAEIQKLL
jgi:pimeloyl-ACP methyl ester carboxylesterase